jgi:CHAT domain-containing protein
MRSFYARLRAGGGAAAALCAAQREMASAGAHPFHWAAFALHGQG